jgi:hypothetical protein
MPSVLDRTVNFLADRLDRRNFLGKAAVVGSAVVAAPLEFGLKPRSAYAAVCNCNGSNCPCGSLCCDGYTEFCCTLNGVNACPPGTITAGWWKVDGSQFCGGAARYYLDCNSQCGSCSCGANGVCSGACSGTGCGCARGSCGNRKAGCTRFRYGQCNQGVRCVGPIVCRVVTCAPPWTFDPACGTSSRTDEATRFHDRPCLNEPFGALDTVSDGGGGIHIRGYAIANTDYRDAGVRLYVDGKFATEVTANTPRPDVARAYPAVGSTTGFDLKWIVGPGRHNVCAYAVDRRNGRTTFIGYKETIVTGPRGDIERITDLGDGRIRVEGWAVDSAAKSSRAIVRFRVANVEVARRQTSLERKDVAWSLPGYTHFSGFSVDIPAPAGRQNVCIDVVNRYGLVWRVDCTAAQVAAATAGAASSEPTTTTSTSTTTTVPPANGDVDPVPTSTTEPAT